MSFRRHYFQAVSWHTSQLYEHYLALLWHSWHAIYNCPSLWWYLLYVGCPGIDARIWEQAKLDNPDPARMIPVPIVGFDELHQRLRLQEQQTSLHQARLEVTSFVIIVIVMPSVLWHCWLGGRKGIRSLKTERWGTGMVICLERGADLHMAQLMPLPLTVSCFSKIQIVFTFLVPAHLGSPGQGAIKQVCRR